MGKVIQFSSFKEEQTINKQLKDIQKELSKNPISQKKLNLLREALQKLYEHIESHLSHQVFLTDSVQQKKLQIGALLNSCYHKWLDKKVDDFTELAQKIVCNKNSSYEKTTKKIHHLKKEIHTLCFNNALSFENKHLIKTAQNYLKNAELQLSENSAFNFSKAQTLRKNYHQIKSEVPKENYEICLNLYELSGNLYHENHKESLRIYTFLPEHIKNEITKKLSEKHLCLSNLFHINQLNLRKEKIISAIQIILSIAYALIHKTEKSFPFDKEEILAIFEDPFFSPNEKVSSF